MRISDGDAARKLARAILADIKLYNSDRYEKAPDRVHELKAEIAEGRALFRTRVEGAMHQVFEEELRVWAKHTGGHGHGPEPAHAQPEPPAHPGQCENCGRPNDPIAKFCASCGHALPVAPLPVHARHPEPSPKPSAREHKEDEERAQRKRESDAEQKRMANVYLLVGAAALSVAAIGVFAETEHEHTTKEKKEGHAAVVTRATTPALAPPSPRPQPPAVAVPSCVCSFGDSQSTPRFTLRLQAPPIDAPISWSIRIERVFGFTTSTTSADFPKRAGAILPPSDGLPQHLGMACDTGLFIVVAGNAASAWSSVDAHFRWNAKLPAELADDADAAAPTILPGTAVAAVCTHLAVKGRAVEVPLASGKRASIALDDGSVR